MHTRKEDSEDKRNVWDLAVLSAEGHKDIINSTMSKTILILLLGLVAVQSISMSHMTEVGLPQPTITTSEGFGGQGSNSFSQFTRFPEFLEVRGVGVNVGAHGWAAGIQLSYGTPDGKIYYKSPNFGVGVPNQFYTVPVGEYIAQVKVTRIERYGWYYESIELVTDKGTVKHFGGNSGAQHHTFAVPAGQRLVGLEGSSGDFLDYLQIVTSPRN